MSKIKNYKKEIRFFLSIIVVMLILLLSTFNLQNKIKPAQDEAKNKVLGITTDSSFWTSFVEKHPTYRDGWLELGRIDKVKEIDPNFFKN